MDRIALFKWTKEQFGTDPEYLWARYPGYAVLRNGGNRKWYALIMDVPRGRLGVSGNGTVDIVDVKCGPIVSGSLRRGQGFLPAYHMNRENWVSVLLDGTVPEEEIKRLIELSYELTAPKQKRASRQKRCEP